MLTLQIGNMGNTCVTSCLDQGGLHSLSALVLDDIYTVHISTNFILTHAGVCIELLQV